MIEFIEVPDMEEWKGYLYAGLFLLTACCSTVCRQQGFYVATVMGMRMRASIMTAVYKKV